jgi:hypothetical protein
VGRRIGAALVGTALIAAAVLAFSLGKHPFVAGTNTASPISPAVVIRGGESRCQVIARVPAKVSHVQLAVNAIQGPPGDLRVKLRERGRKAEFVGGRRLVFGPAVIRLKHETRALHPASLCMHYFGSGQVVLGGERKRLPVSAAHAGGRRGGVASVVFFRPGLSSWASRRDLIADRYANDQSGILGAWSLWLAFFAALGAAGISLWWLVFRLESPARAIPPRRRPGRPLAPPPPPPPESPPPPRPPQPPPPPPREPFDPDG